MLNIASATGVPGVNSTYFNGNASTAANFGTETAQKFEVGVNYALGPGIKAVGGFMYNNFAGPSNAVSATTGSSCWAWTCASSRSPRQKIGKSGRKPALSFAGRPTRRA